MCLLSLPYRGVMPIETEEAEGFGTVWTTSVLIHSLFKSYSHLHSSLGRKESNATSFSNAQLGIQHKHSHCHKYLSLFNAYLASKDPNLWLMLWVWRSEDDSSNWVTEIMSLTEILSLLFLHSFKWVWQMKKQCPGGVCTCVTSTDANETQRAPDDNQR